MARARHHSFGIKDLEIKENILQNLSDEEHVAKSKEPTTALARTNLDSSDGSPDSAAAEATLNDAEQEFATQKQQRGKRRVETIVVADFRSVVSACSARILTMLFHKRGVFATAISSDPTQFVDTNTSHLVNQSNLTYAIILSNSIHTNPIAVAYIHNLVKAFEEKTKANASPPSSPRLAPESFDAAEHAAPNVARKRIDSGASWSLSRGRFNFKRTLSIGLAEPQISIYAEKSSQIPIMTIMASGDQMITASQWREDALDGTLWKNEFWTTLQSIVPELKNDQEGRARIVKDFEAVQRILAFPFNAHQGQQVLSAEFDRIMARWTSLTSDHSA